MKKIKSILLLSAVFSLGIFAQDNAEVSDSDVEEVVVVGSQIKGAKITGALPVSVITSDDIDGLGIDSGDELLDNIAEFGQNTFNQNEFSGGYNAVRGDIGSFNLRDIGTGNTLALLNGRRLITAPGYQTEPILGGSMPVMTVNSQAIPVNGAQRVEILRDGASAIYGADALAGVVNTVLKTDFVGLDVKFKMIAYDGNNAADHKLSINWGKDIGNTNVSVYFDRYDRQEIKGNEDPKWATMDARIYPGLPEGTASEWDDTSWRQTNQASRYGIWYNGTNTFTTLPSSDPRCSSTRARDNYTGTGGNTCVIDYYSSSSSFWDKYRANYNQISRWMRPELERNNLFVFLNSELANGTEAYSEIGIYNSMAEQVLFPGTTLGAGTCGRTGTCTQPMLIPASNYWLNQLVNGDGNSFVENENVGVGLWKRYHRFDTPRGYTSHKTSLRFLQGLRGTAGNWDWDTAVLWSQAKSKQNNTGRHSLTAFNEVAARSTPDAYNPFCGGLGCSSEEEFLTTIIRDNTSSLYLMDFKASNNELFDMPAGPVGMLVGFEIRKEKFADIRDPRINGEVPYVVPVGPNTGMTFPLISDIFNSSATPNASGARVTSSIFTEFAIPLHETVDSQLAIRYEDSDDYGDATVGKFAIGWQPMDRVKLRYSFSETFRAPSLILVNEGFLGRSSSTNDALFEYAAGENQTDYSMQRITEGNPGLQPELGENESIGLVLEPLDDLIVTFDKWSIETEDTVGVFGMTNAVLLDALIRAEGGASECTGNPNVIRNSTPAELEDGVAWPSATLCPAGNVERILDYYVNADTRLIEGLDTSILYSVNTDYGRFKVKFVHVHYDTYQQDAGGDAKRLSDAGQPGGTLAGLAPVRGVESLLGKDGRIEDKYTMSTSWRKGPYEVMLSGTQYGEFVESGHTEVIDGTRVSWPIGEMTMLNLTLGYKISENLKIRLQVKNLEDERAPLADETYGNFWADLHSDFGRNYNLQVSLKF